MKSLNLFQKSRPEKDWLIVEVEKPRAIPPLSEEVAESVATLQSHPGFQYLLQKLRLQRSGLVSSLSHQRHSSLADIEFLQSGIAWTGWLEEQLQKSVGFRAQKPQEIFPSEREAFQEAQRFIEVLE